MAVATGLVRAGCCHGSGQTRFKAAGSRVWRQSKSPTVPAFCLFSGALVTVSTSVRHEGFEPPTFWSVASVGAVIVSAMLTMMRERASR